ncbi:MAG: MFS transporter [Actinomycetota bacterium]|nr:MFS transporter [Actinomycetota bacterium]
MAPPRQGKVGTVRQVPGLAPMLLAALLARTGAMMVGLTMGFVAYEQTTSALTVAMVAAAFGLAFAVSGLVSGQVMERVGLRTMLAGALLLQITGTMVLASVTQTTGKDVVWLIVFSISNGFAAALTFVGTQLLINKLAPKEHLQHVVSLDAGAASVARIAGPALGGVLLAQLGIPPVFLIAAVGFVPMAVAVVTLAGRVSAGPPAKRTRLRDAVHFVWELPLLRWAIFTAILGEALALPLVPLMPALTESLNRDAADRLGILVACVALGSVGQMFLIDRLRARHEARVIVAIAYAASGALLIGLALDDELFVGGFLLVLFGLAVSIGRTLLLTSVHVGSPDSHRHHVLSLYLFVTAAATPLAALLWGATADAVGIDPTIAGAGLLLMFLMAAGLISYRRHPAAVPPAEADPVSPESRPAGLVT